MKKSEQIQQQIADLSRQLLAAIEDEATPKPVLASTDELPILVGPDSEFSFEDGKLTISDRYGDTAVIDLTAVLPPTWPRSETTFRYNGVARRGVVIGMQEGRYITNVEVLETWNERDGDTEPTYKLFTSDMIHGASRPKD